MKRERMIAALQQVADENGMSLEMVIGEIDQMIETSMKSPDPCVQERWARIPRTGKVPTALELMEYLIEQARARGFRIS